MFPLEKVPYLGCEIVPFMTVVGNDTLFENAFSFDIWAIEVIFLESSEYFRKGNWDCKFLEFAWVSLKLIVFDIKGDCFGNLFCFFYSIYLI